jgi:uncharacterized lipoprotein
MEFKIILSREERLTLLKGLWDQQYKVNSDITELQSIEADWAKDELIKYEEKRKELYKLQIKLEG